MCSQRSYIARRSLVNTGALYFDRETAEARVLAMQTKLHRGATADHDRCFDDVFNLVYDPAFLVTAWHRIRGNGGFGMNTWRAGCGESRMSGSEGGPRKPSRRQPARALRSDP